MTMRRLIAISVIIVFVLSGCSFDLGTKDPEEKNWDLLVKSAENTSVTIAVEHSNASAIEWFREDFSEYLKMSYGIDVNIVEQTLEKTMARLESDKVNEVAFGEIDIVLMEGVGFKTARMDGLLYGPFSDKLPNVTQNLSTRSMNFSTREGITTDYYSIPYSRKQLSFIYNQDVFYETPLDYAALFEIIMENKGAFTYPDPRFTEEGEAFILSVIGETIDFEAFLMGNFDKDAFVKAIEPGIDKLKRIKPYLFEAGMKYPTSIDELDDLFNNSALMMSMTLNFNFVTDKLREYEYLESASTFVIPTGVATYDEIAVIAFNSPNKSGAMVALNALLSPDMQSSKYNPRNWGSLTVYNAEVVPSSALEGFKAARLKSTTVSYNDFMKAVMPEFTPEMISIVLERWEEEVLVENNE